ncbi:odontogenic ameloblast-associated protein isoform X2 [Sminthopsis crassicaudata]|uniref:odontogenic ameloblast-associated protein isoform X2 n=1 Tax=Sminthopsis crassicaudata TaxID=9301 RepID=UPI003D699939
MGLNAREEIACTYIAGRGQKVQNSGRSGFFFAGTGSEVFLLKMRTVIFLGFLGVTFAAPFIPQPLLSASNSNELLMGLNNARLQMLQQSFQSRTQTPGLSQISWSSLGHLGGLVPNQIPFPGQIKLSQRTQAIQQEPSQLQTLQQNQQDPYQMIPCFFSYGLPQVWGQTVQYYPICVYGPQDLPPQFFPLQAEQPQPQEQAEPLLISEADNNRKSTSIDLKVSPAGQQQMNFDLLRGDIPESPGMPIENILPYPQRDIVNLGYPYAEIFMPSYTSKHQAANILAPATDTDNIIPVELVEEKINPDMLKEP